MYHNSDMRDVYTDLMNRTVSNHLGLGTRYDGYTDRSCVQSPIPRLLFVIYLKRVISTQLQTTISSQEDKQASGVFKQVSGFKAYSPEQNVSSYPPLTLQVEGGLQSHQRAASELEWRPMRWSKLLHIVLGF